MLKSFAIALRNTASAAGGAGQRVKGKVKWFSGKKGYGFLVPDEEPSKEVFVHFTAIQLPGYRSLRDGEFVEFSYKNTPKGYVADEVHLPAGTP